MKRVLFIAIATGIGCSALASMDQAAVKRELMMAASKVQAAMAAKDAAPILATMAPNFRWIHIGRPDENKTQAAASLKRLFDTSESVVLGINPISWKFSGNTVTIIDNGQITIRTKPTDKDKMSHVMIGRGKTRETFTKTKNGWKATRFVDLPGEKWTMDGKPYNMRQMVPMKKGKGG
jgi:hypothetical protein